MTTARPRRRGDVDAVRGAGLPSGVEHAGWGGDGRIAHGTSGGAAIDAAGNLTRPVIGPVLDGTGGRPRVGDTDGGRLDADPRWDHAVGPAQLLPAVWTEWRARVARDGSEPDPQQVDDAALTAARFLCDAGGDLATPRGWWQAMRAQDPSVRYAQHVFSAAQEYAASSAAAGD